MGCDSCGRETPPTELIEVHRAYFFDADDPEPNIMEDVERWCSSCAHTYPHLRVEEDGR